jgi:hypothetical protein
MAQHTTSDRPSQEVQTASSKSPDRIAFFTVKQVLFQSHPIQPHPNSYPPNQQNYVNPHPIQIVAHPPRPSNTSNTKQPTTINSTQNRPKGNKKETKHTRSIVRSHDQKSFNLS